MTGFWPDLFHAAWERAAKVSNAISDTLIEASSAPLNATRQTSGVRAVRLQAIPLQVVNRIFGTDGGPADSGDPAEIPARRIVRETEACLALIPGGGGLLSHAVDRVSQSTGYEKKRVRSVILRNFQTHGELVWKLSR